MDPARRCLNAHCEKYYVRKRVLPFIADAFPITIVPLSQAGLTAKVRPAHGGMEEREKLEKEISDIEAQIVRVTPQAESAQAKDEDKRYFREKELLLRKEKLLLLEKLEKLGARGMRGALGTLLCVWVRSRA